MNHGRVIVKSRLLATSFYLIKLGEKPRGLIGHGYIARESYSAPHYNNERAQKGEKTNHIDAEFDRIFNYELEKYVPLIKRLWDTFEKSDLTGLSARQ